MAREIHLDGGEITILKTLGLTGTQVFGKILLERVDGMESAELIDTLNGLMERGFVLSNKVNMRLLEDFEKAFFRVNASYARDLRDAINPGRRREDTHKRRQRRS